MSLKFRSEKQPLVIYHAHCLDGFTAAFIAHEALSKLGQEPELLADEYTKGLVAVALPEWPVDVVDRDIYIVDFSYPADMLRALCDQANDVIVLDHHESAVKKLQAAFPDLESLPANLTLILDQELSGAGLTWQHFNCFEIMPDLVAMVQDRDLWRFELEDSKAFCTALGTYEKTLRNWKNFLIPTEVAALIHEGYVLLKAQDSQMRSIMQGLRDIVIAGHIVPVANCPGYLASEFGNYVMKAHRPPFSATYFDGATHRHWSLRSNDASVNVAEIAEVRGGGGHRNAAGFLTPLGYCFPSI